ncbi:MAG: hypothetical protein M3463_16655, partial [Verrucomicrobiota bacterium]|nr:hypothetical protein [Verrucomicrobiota bacterium]
MNRLLLRVSGVGVLLLVATSVGVYYHVATSNRDVAQPGSIDRAQTSPASTATEGGGISDVSSRTATGESLAAEKAARLPPKLQELIDRLAADPDVARQRHAKIIELAWTDFRAAAREIRKSFPADQA